MAELTTIARPYAEAAFKIAEEQKAFPTWSKMLGLVSAVQPRANDKTDLALELEALPRLNSAIKVATEAGDNGSRDLFESLMKDEEHHIDFLEKQIHLVKEHTLTCALGDQPESGGG